MYSAEMIEDWRDLWSTKAEFYLACLAYIFSINNINGLSTEIKDNGGVAYVIVYLISLFAVCLPLIVMELATGQVTARSPIQAIGKMCPLLQGVGLGQVLLGLIVASFLGIQVGYYGIYLVHLFMNLFGDLPWTICTNWWNGPACAADVNNSGANSDFFKLYIQNVSDSIQDTGDLQWRPIAGAGGAWFLVFLGVVGGIWWLGKIVYFTVLIPISILLILSIRALIMPGVAEELGVVFSLNDKTWDYLLDAEVWMRGFARSILAVGLCFGAYITLGSYNKHSNNLVLDSCLFVVLHILFTIVQLFIQIGLTVTLGSDAVAENFDPILGVALKALSKLNEPHVWAALILVAAILMMLNTMYVLTYSAIATIEDAFLVAMDNSRPFARAAVAFAMCCLGYCLGLGYTVQAGPHALSLLKYYFDLLPFWILLFFEIIAISWLYCSHMLGVDIMHMLTNKCCWGFGFFISYITYLLPVVPMFILVVKMMHIAKVDTEAHSQIAVAEWVEPIAWLCAVVPLLPIPLVLIYVMTMTCLRNPGATYWERFKSTIMSPMRYEEIKTISGSQAYSGRSPGYVLLPTSGGFGAPLAEPEIYNDQTHYTSTQDRALKVSNI